MSRISVTVSTSDLQSDSWSSNLQCDISLEKKQKKQKENPMPYVCYECKLWYGHPLTWCPGCGKKMLKVKDTLNQFQEARKNGWKSEGDRDLYEYYLDGELITKEMLRDSNYDRYKCLYKAVYDKYPLLFQQFGITDYSNSIINKNNLNWIHGDRTINLKIVSDDKKVQINFERPRITFRLVGSDLPIEPVGWNDELPLDATKL